MADPLIQRSQAVTAGAATPLSRDLRAARAYDVVLGLLVVVALPLAIVAVPNTVSVVSALLPPGVPPSDMIRAHGLALPAMMLTVPLAVLLVRRVRAAPVLVGGLTILAVADVAGGFADTVSMVGTLRALHGVGAGLLVPATLVAVWERATALRALWAATLAVSMVGAQALALWPLDDVASWRVTLQPYPLLTGVALALAALYMVVRMFAGDAREAASIGAREGESGPKRAALVLAPAVGIAVLAFGISYDWPQPVVVLASAVCLLALLVMAALGGSFEGRGARQAAFAMVVVGAVVLPTGAQVTNMELGGMGGPGLSGLWPAFALTVVLALAGAWPAVRARAQALTRIGEAGLVALVAGLCAVWFLVPAEQGIVLLAPFGLIVAGAAVALAASFASTGLGGALYALSLCFPAMLSGFLLASGIQMPGLRAATSRQALMEAFLSALRLWALVGGFLVVLVIVAGAFLARRASAAAGGAVVLEMPDGDERGGGDGEDRDDSDDDGEDPPPVDRPSVPPPTPSPEGGTSPR
ncbi:hypothetical protein [Spongiactinospora sp. TRM90649]|uniref:hypothetical protein n=1 Tax=Spongiactinospora sp. TRM90649 TaxID=3031114 RepID=UPI0023F63807|nr:hypothetical protein [Spongiactinospora sp. TRM90649]MDF5755256.1 hypothetical protein [Spongiactinospora sp. TRM90649]